MGKLLLKLFVKDYKNTENPLVRKKYGLVASFFGLITNLILFIGKIILGVALGLFSLVSDSINNLSDFGNNALSVFGVNLTYKPADKEHPYGHQRTEYVISLIIGCVVIALGAVMAYQGINDFVSFVKSMKENGHPVVQNLSDTMFIVTLCILAFAILIKVAQSLIYFSYGKMISSQQLKALGKDALNDCIATSLVIIGLLITYFTGYDVDCFFTVAVAVLVIISGIGIIKEAANSLIGEKPSKETIDSMVSIFLAHKEVLGIHDLEVHSYGHNSFAVIHVEVDAKEDVMVSHQLCDHLEREVLEKLNIHLTVHMDPILINDPDTEKYKEVVDEYAKKHLAHVHDFRLINNKGKTVIVFDMILPENIDNQNRRERIKNELTSSIKEKYDGEFKLIIHFDSLASDLLSGTEAEK